jgi:hypothetical protein
LLGSSWDHRGRSSIGDVACGLATGTRYDVAHRLTQGLLLGSRCICLLLTVHRSCGISVLSLLTLLICLAGLRRYVDGDHKDLSIQDLEHVALVVGEMVVRAICNVRQFGDGTRLIWRR